MGVYAMQVCMYIYSVSRTSWTINDAIRHRPRNKGTIIVCTASVPPLFLTKVSLKSNSLYWNDPINSETSVILGLLALAFYPNYPLTLIK